jgi:hypothetical protein
MPIYENPTHPNVGSVSDGLKREREKKKKKKKTPV